MPDAIHPLRHHDVPPESIPTGEQLLDRASKPYLAWVPAGKSIVLGNSQDPEKELNLDAISMDGIPVFKRMSGGGAVLLSPGCVCLGLRFAKDKSLSIQDFFAKGSALISGVALEKLGVRLVSRGTSDLAYTGSFSHAGGPIPEQPGGQATHSGQPETSETTGYDHTHHTHRKVAGCALYMPRDFVLYLVSILIDADISDIGKYLAYPSKEPQYRAGRKHEDFLAGLASLSTTPVRPSEFAGWLEEIIPDAPGLNLDWELAR